MKKSIILFLFLLSTGLVFSQTRVFTKNGKVKFDATSPSSPEQIIGNNDKATSVLDFGTGAIQFAVLMKAFLFEKALMQEHFNENYVESDKFPKSDFKGQVINIKEVDLEKDGNYKVKVKGKLTLHGITKDIEADGTLTVKDKIVTAGKSEFKVQLSDFDIEVPTIVNDKLNKEALISVDMNYELLKTS